MDGHGQMSVSGIDGARDGAAGERVPPDPLISVCITNHNYGRFLSSAIESVLAQSYPRVELIVVDDGSTDASRDVIDGYVGRVVALLQEQAGQAAAGWAGVRAAAGDVVVFLDSDDTLDPDICSRVAEAFAHDPDLAIVQWRLRQIDESGNPVAGPLPPRRGVLPSGDLGDHVLRVRNWSYQVTSGMAYAMWVARRILPARLPDGEYHALDHWLSELAPLLGSVRSLDEIGASHRVHGENFSALHAGAADWSRRLIRLTLNTHEHVRRLAFEIGRPCPEDARELRDPALLGWQLLSLTLDPARHPFPDDRRAVLAGKGALASLRHPHFSWRHRLKRAIWFVAVGTLPRPVARAITSRYAIDVPVRTPRR
jgi:hypothetical protein